MTRSLRVFISSTWQDLRLEREAAEKALRRMGDTIFVGMEYFGSREETPKEVSLAEMDKSDIYIGLVGCRYGSGITEAEYRRATERNIPCLIYIKDENIPLLPDLIEKDPHKIAKLAAFKQTLKSQHTISYFSDADQLATKIVADLHNLSGRMSAMDVTAFARAVAAFLIPFLPYIVKMGEGASEEAGKKAGEHAWTKVRALWKELAPKIEAKPAAHDAVQKAMTMPQDDGVRLTLELQLEDILKENMTLACKLEDLWKEIQSAEIRLVSAGERGIAIGGDANGTILITGNQNVLRDIEASRHRHGAKKRNSS